MTPEEKFQELIKNYGEVLFIDSSRESPSIKSQTTSRGQVSIYPGDKSRKGQLNRELVRYTREHITFVGQRQTLMVKLYETTNREEFWTHAFSILDEQGRA